ncbi:hypothetical protein LCGC14_1320330 [marine sediment metagenome]|uniref:Helix-turn-helix domain-containing protein n=1 Tax=marine sediment metagenome TaxID=412755 RepID=A0A0F9NM37_9ZZZZ
MITIANIVFLDVSEVATKLEVSERWVMDKIRSGKLSGRKIGNRWIVSEEVLLEFACGA